MKIIYDALDFLHRWRGLWLILAVVIFYTSVVCVGICRTIWENTHAPHKPEPEEARHSCCYNCPTWFEDAAFENCELSGICTIKSTEKVSCYTPWNFICNDYSGNAPEEEQRG